MNNRAGVRECRHLKSPRQKERRKKNRPRVIFQSMWFSHVATQSTHFLYIHNQKEKGICCCLRRNRPHIYTPSSYMCVLALFGLVLKYWKIVPFRFQLFCFVFFCYFLPKRSLVITSGWGFSFLMACIKLSVSEVVISFKRVNTFLFVFFFRTKIWWHFYIPLQPCFFLTIRIKCYSS